MFANVRVGSATDPGKLTVVPSDGSTSAPSSVDYRAMRAEDSGVAIKLGPDGKIKVRSNAASSTHFDLLIDIEGYFTTGGTDDQGGLFTPLPGVKIYDSADTSAIGASQTRTIPVTGLGGIPDNAGTGSVAVTVTALSWTVGGAVVLYNPDDGRTGGVSTLGFSSATGSDASVGATTTAIITPSDDGEISIYNGAAGTVRILLTTQGWFTADPVAYDDDVDSPDAEFPDYTPEFQAVSSASSSTLTYTPSLPSAYSVAMSGGTAIVKDSTGTRVGSFQPTAVDASGASVSSTVSTPTPTTISIALTGTGIAYPVMAAPVYSDDNDPNAGDEADEVAGDISTTPPIQPDGTTDITGSPNVDEVNGEGDVTVDPTAPTYDELMSTVQIESLSGKGPKVKVPRNYHYHPKTGPDKALHDYCTKSPDTFNNVTWRGPCAIHDMCYHTLKYNPDASNGRAACDGDLKYNMKKQCRHYLSQWNPERASCYAVAYVYWGAVKSHTFAALYGS